MREPTACPVCGTVHVVGRPFWCRATETYGSVTHNGITHPVKTGPEPETHLTVTPGPMVYWQRCPVCEGRGHVPLGFYRDIPADAGVTEIAMTCCRTCAGRGMVRRSA
jgi:hypothetical protein